MVSQSYFGYVLLLSAVLLGIACGSISSLVQTITVQLSPQHRLGIANSTYFVFYDLGVAIGPLLFGILLPLEGYRKAFALFALITFACIILYYYLHGKKASIINKEKNKV